MAGCLFGLNFPRAFFLFFYFFFFFVFVFKNISLISRRSFIKGGRKTREPGENHLTIRKQNLPFSHVTRALGSMSAGLNILIRHSFTDL